MRFRRLAVLLLLAPVALSVVSVAGAKDFGPGDLRVCDATRCVAVMDANVLPLLGRFYYSGRHPAVARPPSMRAPYFELRFRNGYVTGIVATQRLDRFLSYGVYLGRFRRGTWYRVPARLGQEFRELTASLTPFRLTPEAVSKSR
jgi:hypothetical protein